MCIIEKQNDQSGNKLLFILFQNALLKRVNDAIKKTFWQIKELITSPSILTFYRSLRSYSDVQ